MRVGKATLTVAAIGLAGTASSASAVELRGYWRTGIGGTSRGGAQRCFGLNQLGYKFRLGNECETYGEIELRERLYKDERGAEFDFVGMLRVQTAQRTTSDSLKTDADLNDIALRQIWIGGKLPQLGGATIWAGNRYFHRADVHIIDFYYWDPSGPGAGIEDVAIGLGKLALTVFQSPGDALGPGEPLDTSFHGTQARRQTWRPELRIYDIPFPLGKLEVGLDLFVDATNARLARLGANAQKASPWATVQLSTSLLGGFNKLAFQWATGSAAVMSGTPQLDNTRDSKHWRVVEQLMVNPVPALSGMIAFVYEDMDRKLGGKDDFNSARLLTVGLRPELHFSDFFKLVAEGGYQRVEPKSDRSGVPGRRTLTKITVAPTLVAGRGFSTRPEVRAFVTYARWNDAAARRCVASGGSGGACDPVANPWGNDRYGVTFGAQVEAWW